MTFQIGNAPYIAAECNLPVISDFRTTDVALGGQGAPLVPIGDRLLFGEYGFCLNLGGFANISNDLNGSRIACDLCPVNIVSNELSKRIGFEYDADGKNGSRGKLIRDLIMELNELPFYKIKGPKSLGREWVETAFMPVMNKYKASISDLLRSFYEHVSDQICHYINSNNGGIVLITGGGVFNKFLIELIRSKTKREIVIPDENVVKYKEALIFAFLGMLRFKNQVNCLASVTGARKDSSGGGVYLA
jgi:anhydro-N-acetylmuramic acid kinase